MPEDKQPKAAEDMECPGQNHPGKTRRSGQKKTTTKCERSRPDAPDWKILGGTCSNGRRPPDRIVRGQVAARHPGRAHRRRNKEQRLPPPRLDDPGTSGR